MVDNGVIHVIDTVMLPPPSPKAYALSLPGISLPFGFFDPLGANTNTPSTCRQRLTSHPQPACLA